MRATWQVRNDRAPFLRVSLPPGWKAVSARVAGRPVPLSRDGDALLVPLEKSTETMVGRVQLPVELSAIGPGDAWVRRGWQDLLGPTVDAPVSRVEWQVTLPPERTAKKTDGARAMGPDTRVVDVGSAMRDANFQTDFDGDYGGGADGDGPMGFDGEQGRGLALRKGDKSGGKLKEKKEAKKDASGAPDDASKVLEETARKRTSTAYWSAAYDAYKTNDFDRAEELLEKSQELDPNNYAAQQLQSNLAVLNAAPTTQSDEDEAVARRVKAMARAKSGKTEEAQTRLEREAADAERSGDLDKAVEAYRQLVQTTSQLANLEENEAVDQKRRLEDVRQRLERVEQQAGQSSSFAGNNRRGPEEVTEEEEESVVADGLFESRGVAEQSNGFGGMGLLGTGAGGGGLGGDDLGLDFVEGGVEGGVVGGLAFGAAGRELAVPANGPTTGANGRGEGSDLTEYERDADVVVERNFIVMAEPPPPPPADAPPPAVRAPPPAAPGASTS